MSRTNNAASRHRRLSHLPLDTILAGDCIAALKTLPGRSRSTSSSPTRPTTCSSRATCTAPTRARSTRVDDDWDKFASFADYDDFTRAWLPAAAAS